MAKSTVKLSNKSIKKVVLWGLLLFFSFMLVASCLFKMQEGLMGSYDVSNVNNGNVISLSNDYVSGTSPNKMANIYSSLSTSYGEITGNAITSSNVYNGPVSTGSTVMSKKNSYP